jgi:hypothetical protein
MLAFNVMELLYQNFEHQKASCRVFSGQQNTKNALLAQVRIQNTKNDIGEIRTHAPKGHKISNLTR